MEYTHCSLCGQDDTELLFVAPDNGHGSDAMTSIVRCRKCGFVYANPRIESDHISEYYPPDSYYSYQQESKRSLGSYLKTVARRSVPGYDKNLSLLDRLLSKTIGRLLLVQMDVVIPFRDKGRILDVGCGNGSMIGWMRDHGWETYGVEISERACEAASQQGLQTFCGQLQDAGYDDAYFDVVTLNHVVEHLYHPLETLSECHRILEDDGLLVVDCPNFDCYDSKLFREDCHLIEAPRHINHFTRVALEKLLNDAGFEIKTWKFKLPIPVRDRISLHYFKRNHADAGFARILVVEIRATVLKVLGYLFSRNRGEKYSWNITAYAIKRRP